jgi:UDP-N-acetylenolpyruvoylglucosamine reductase
VDDVREILRRELPGLEEAVPLAPLCAYRVGGPAEFLYAARDTNALAYAVRLARELGVPLTVLGWATNVLVGDDGLPGLVVLARNERYVLEGDVLRVEAGAELPGLVADLARQGLAGLEFAGNIPGSIGGAIVGNAGAYGRAVSDVLVEVQLLEGRVERRAAPAELAFGYRTSLLKSRPDLIVLAGTFALAPGEPRELLENIARDAELRRSKHPLEYASCGSYFKNPSRELPAARLIEEAGLKGLTIGRAQVSEKHANFLVALEGATTADILALAAEVKRRVREHSGVELVEEVRLLGVGPAEAGAPAAFLAAP